MVRRAAAFQLAWLAQPRAAKFFWFVAACLHQYCERNDVGFVRRPLLDWGSDGPELCPLRPHEPRFTRLACASAVKIGAQAGPTFDGREHDGSFAMLVAPTTA